MRHILILVFFALISISSVQSQEHLAVFPSSKMATDPLSRSFITPTRILWVSNDSLISGKEKLLSQGTGQPIMGRKGMCSLTTSASDTASILIDYGRELHGGIKLVLGSAKPWGTAQIRIRLGESVSEAMSEHNGGKRRKGFSTNDHAIRDFELTIPSDGQIEIGNSGFRFARIDLLSHKTIHIQEAPAILRYRDIPYLGSFKCSDERLNRIWNTGAYTVHLNMQEYLWDGIKRDRLIWLGDMHPEVSTIMAVFGDNEVVNRTLDLACQLYPLPKWMNNMSAYSMWYLIILQEWYMHNGDKSYLKHHHAYIKGLIERIDACVDANGNETLAKERFLDWPSSTNKKGVEAGYRALLYWSLADAEKLCHALDDAVTARLCRDIQNRLKKKILPHNQLKQAASLMAIAGWMTPQQACEDVVSVGGAKDFSTFYGYYMLEAMARASRYEEAMKIISQYWGAMLDLGATTFWEDFNLDWARNAGRIDEFVPEGKADIHRDFGAYCYPGYRHSFCHGWASGPTAWLTRHVLGVEVVEAGCRTLRIQPNLGSLEWVEGTYPTPHGVVYIRHSKQADGKIKTEVKAPEVVKILR